ncbi:MAG: hypothetical protein BWY31_04529 [Lentisphaerae bacterium ADurb.Bin242]|nr:MAG: hypothetical protein BWY31_04529 [Lentisphaerae bacterium ADurb.Bin242]
MHVPEFVAPETAVVFIGTGSRPGQIEVKIHDLVIRIFNETGYRIQLVVEETFAVQTAVHPRGTVAFRFVPDNGVQQVIPQFRFRIVPELPEIIPFGGQRRNSFCPIVVKNKVSVFFLPVAEILEFVFQKTAWAFMFKKTGHIAGPGDRIDSGTHPSRRRVFRFDRSRLKVKLQFPFPRELEGGIDEFHIQNDLIRTNIDRHAVFLVPQMPAAPALGTAHHPDIIAAAPEERIVDRIVGELSLFHGRQIFLMPDGGTVIKSGHIFPLQRDFKFQFFHRCPRIRLQPDGAPEHAVEFRTDIEFERDGFVDRKKPVIHVGVLLPGDLRTECDGLSVPFQRKGTGKQFAGLGNERFGNSFPAETVSPSPAGKSCIIRTDRRPRRRNRILVSGRGIRPGRLLRKFPV